MRAALLGLIGLLAAGCGGGQERASLPPPSRPLVSTPDEPFRWRPPAPEAVRRAFRAPELVTERLDNGLLLALWPRPGAPVTALRYVTRRGGEDGPADQAGLSWVLGRVLELGTDDSGTDASPSLEAAGFDPAVEVGWDEAALALRLDGERLPEAMGLFARALRSPTFGESQVGQARREALERIDRSLRSPERAALHWAKTMLYGLDHRGAAPPWGRRSVVSETTRAALMARHHIAWGPREGALIVVGDHQMETLRPLVEEAFGDWTTEAPPRPEPGPWVALDSPTVARAMGLQSSSPRSVILMAERAPGRLHRDHVPFTVLSIALAGMSSSWLNLQLREACESCSGAEALYDARLAGGELILTIEAGRRGISQVLGLLLEELRRLIDQGPDEASLAAARVIARQRLLASLERSDRAARTLGELFVLGEEPAVLEETARELESVTAEQVREVAERWLRPDRAPIVVTGNTETISLAFNVNSIAPALYRNR